MSLMTTSVFQVKNMTRLFFPKDFFYRDITRDSANFFVCANTTVNDEDVISRWRSPG